MTAYHLRPLAIADLDGVWSYTLEAHGRAQATSYVQQIEDACAGFAAMFEAGRDVGFVLEGCRAWPAGQHVVYARMIDGTFVVERILHKRMDVPRHLSPRGS